jgi:hypothetical protein
VAAEARPAKIDSGEGNEIDIPERKVVTVAVATAIDALKRSTIGSGNGVGLRSGTFQSSVDMNGNQTTTLTNCVFATDVTINGSLVWGADRSFVADVSVSGSGTAAENAHLRDMGSSRTGWQVQDFRDARRTKRSLGSGDISAMRFDISTWRNYGGKLQFPSFSQGKCPLLPKNVALRVRGRNHRLWES